MKVFKSGLEMMIIKATKVNPGPKNMWMKLNRNLILHIGIIIMGHKYKEWPLLLNVARNNGFTSLEEIASFK